MSTELTLVLYLVLTILMLVVFIAIRFARGFLPWVKLDKGQLNTLQETNRQYGLVHPPAVPAGKPLYRGGTSSGQGFSVYQNGIRGKFCIGAKGRNRFVPFEEITDIYPVRVETPFPDQRARQTTASWKALQIETGSAMVCVLHSRNQDFGRLVPALKDAMGARWSQVYHPDQELWTNYLTGDAGKHKLVRPAKAGGPETAAPSVLPKRVSSTTDKGRLLLQESKEDVDKRVKGAKVAAAIIAAMAVIFVFFSYIISYYTAGEFFWYSFLFYAVIFGGIFGLLAVVFYRVGQKMTPTMVYENGIETYSPMGTKRLFVSYGEMSVVREVHSRIIGDYYMFNAIGSADTIAVSKNVKGFPEMLDSIRARMGKEEYVVRLPKTVEEERSSRRLEYAIYALGLIIGVSISSFAALGIYGGGSPVEMLLALGLYVPLVTIPSVTFMVFAARNLRSHLPRRLNVKIPAGMVVGLVAFFFVSVGVFGLVISDIPAAERHIEPKPASSYLAPGTYSNATVYVGGYILVDVGQTLAFSNCTVFMNLTTDKAFGIWVAEGGTLDLENTTLQSSNSIFTYPFEIMGSARIIGSTIYNLWADPAWEDYDGGLEIYSSDVQIDRSHFADARLTTILVVDSSPTISNSKIERAGDDGIELEHANPHIFNNTIVNCEYAMYINRGSAPLVEFNLFAFDLYGLLVEYSNPVIRNNAFRHIENFAIEYRRNSAPILSGNTYIENGANILTQFSASSMELCGIIVVVEAVACLLVLFWIRKEETKRERSGFGRYRLPGGPDQS